MEIRTPNFFIHPPLNNNISHIRLSADQWIYDRIAIGDYFINQYQNLFKSNEVLLDSELDDLIQAEVTSDEQISLEAIPDSTEIYQTLKAMNPYKASGPDGYPGISMLNVGTSLVIL